MEMVAAEACMAVANTAAVMNVFVFMGLLWVVFVAGFFFEMFRKKGNHNPPSPLKSIHSMT